MAYSQTVWIDLVAGAVGLNGPFLQHFHRPFLYLGDDLPNDAFPQMIVFIGDTSKRLSRKRIFGLENNDYENRIHLHLLYKQPGPVLLADCELHLLSRMPTVRAGPIPGDRVQHLIRDVPRDANLPELATRVYTQLLSPFSTLICIFSDDFGGTTAVANFLATWLANKSPITSDIPNFPRPRVLILKEWDIFKRGSFDEARAYKKFRWKLALRIRSTNKVNQGTSLADEELDIYIRKHFDSIKLQIFPPYSREGEAVSKTWASLQARILQDSEEIIEKRIATRTAFSITHFQALFQTACLRFAANSEAKFSFLQASRLTNPVPTDASAHLQTFLEHAKRKKLLKFAVQVISSTIALDCYPPDMHWFAPRPVFQNLYHHIIQQTVHGVCPGPEALRLSEDIERNFYDIADKTFNKQMDITISHKALMIQSAEVWRNFHLDSVCLSCVMEAPQVMLGTPTEPWLYNFIRCPLCQLPNLRPTRIKPYTAGPRSLGVDCDHSEVDMVVHFLRELQRALSIKSSLRDHFDFATGTGSGGGPLILRIFCENWSLNDCVKYLKKQPLRYQKPWQKALGAGLDLALKAGLNRERRIFDSFGNRETIAVASGSILPRINGAEKGLDLHLHKRASSTLADKPLNKTQSIPDFMWAQAGRLPDVSIACEPLKHGICTQSDRRWSATLPPDDQTLVVLVADRLLASLFYIELVREPLFYPYRTACELQMRCRLPSGPLLSDLVARLCQENIYYKATEPKFLKAPICPSDVWNEVKAGRPFLRYLDVEVFSLDSVIDVRIGSIIREEEEEGKRLRFKSLSDGNDTVADNAQHISNCPYRLGNLIKDQALDCRFGHRDHQSRLAFGRNTKPRRKVSLEIFDEKSRFSDSSFSDEL